MSTKLDKYAISFFIKIMREQMVGDVGIEMLLGKQHPYLKDFNGVQVHERLLAPLLALSKDAEANGFQLAIASAYRSFDRQLLIWNSKAGGGRPVLGEDGTALDTSALSDSELLFAILRWSALPGASRHHWGTDVDIYDYGPSKRGYQLQLTVEETLDGGVYSEFYTWLDGALDSGHCDFFRPYTRGQGGVAPEPWHLSFAPVSRQYQDALSKDAILQVLMRTDIKLKSEILDHFDEIYERFVVV